MYKRQGQHRPELGIADHPVDGGRHPHGLLVGKDQPCTLDRLGYCRVGVGHDGKTVVHRLQEGNTESLVVGQAHERVAAGVVGDQLLVGDRSGEVQRVGQVQFAGESLHRPLIVVTDGAADQVQPGVGIVQSSVGGERLDQVVLALVGRDLPDEEEIGASPCLLVGEPRGGGGVGRAGEAVQIDEERHGRGGAVPGHLELTFVEGRVGDGELGDRRQITELGTAPPDLVTHLRYPRLEQVGRGDVVVVCLLYTSRCV